MLQLGVLRDALISAGVESTQAAAAAEEVAGYENRLTRLSTQMQVVIAVLLILVGSQAALWAEYGKLGSQVSDLQARTGRIEEQMAKTNSLILAQLIRITGASH